MSAVVQRDHEDEFFDSQMLPPQERGVTFEALYFRQLQLVTNRIHETENIDQIMLEASQDICKLFNADRRPCTQSMKTAAPLFPRSRPA